MKIAELNKEVRETFAQVMVLPEWDNAFCYWTKCPKVPSRLQTTEAVAQGFGLRKAQTAPIDKIIDCALETAPSYRQALRGMVHYEQLKLRNKDRTLQRLAEAGVIKVIDEYIVPNPAVLYGKDWYSPFVQGVLLTEYMNEVLVPLHVNDIPSDLERQLTIRGVEHALDCIKNNQIIDRCNY